MLIFLMSLFSFPLGVIAAIYLREYARDGLVVRLVRIAVNNLAGIPSIVYGIFGLGFFVYGIGCFHRPDLLSGTAADADLRYRRHPLGQPDPGAAHRAGGDRRHRRGPGGDPGRGARRLPVPGGDQIPDA